FLHARKGHLELVCEIGDGGVAAPEPIEDATARRVGKGGEGGVEVHGRILSHVVQYRGIGVGAQGGVPKGLSSPSAISRRHCAWHAQLCFSANFFRTEPSCIVLARGR